jgi:hypothetical protein
MRFDEVLSTGCFSKSAFPQRRKPSSFLGVGGTTTFVAFEHIDFDRSL